MDKDKCDQCGLPVKHGRICDACGYDAWSKTTKDQRKAESATAPPIPAAGGALVTMLGRRDASVPPQVMVGVAAGDGEAHLAAIAAELEQHLPRFGGRAVLLVPQVDGEDVPVRRSMPLTVMLEKLVSNTAAATLVFRGPDAQGRAHFQVLHSTLQALPVGVNVGDPRLATKDQRKAESATHENSLQRRRAITSTAQLGNDASAVETSRGYRPPQTTPGRHQAARRARKETSDETRNIIIAIALAIVVGAVIMFQTGGLGDKGSGVTANGGAVANRCGGSASTKALLVTPQILNAARQMTNFEQRNRYMRENLPDQTMTCRGNGVPAWVLNDGFQVLYKCDGCYSHTVRYLPDRKREYRRL